MILDAMKFLASQTRAADKVQIVHPDHEPDDVYIVATADGKVERRIAEAVRNSEAGDLSAIIDLTTANDMSEIWYSRAGVLGLVGDWRNTVRIDLTPSVPLRHLIECKQSITHSALVLLLRTTFADCMSECPDLLNIIRSIRFEQNTAGQSEVKHAKTSIGKQLTAELSGTGILPEYVTLVVPVFDAVFPFVAPVRCAFEPLPSSASFMIIPLPGETEKALALGEEMLGDLIRKQVGDATTNVYYGEFNR